MVTYFQNSDPNNQKDIHVMMYPHMFELYWKRSYQIAVFSKLQIYYTMTYMWSVCLWLQQMKIGNANLIKSMYVQCCCGNFRCITRLDRLSSKIVLASQLNDVAFTFDPLTHCMFFSMGHPVLCNVHENQFVLVEIWKNVFVMNTSTWQVHMQLNASSMRTNWRLKCWRF